MTLAANSFCQPDDLHVPHPAPLLYPRQHPHPGLTVLANDPTFINGILSVPVTAGGTYLTAPTIVIEDTTGTGGAATAVLNGTSISSLTITAMGKNYTRPTFSASGWLDCRDVWDGGPGAGVLGGESVPRVEFAEHQWKHTTPSAVLQAVQESGSWKEFTRGVELDCPGDIGGCMRTPGGTGMQ